MRSDLTSSDAEVRRWNRSHRHAIRPMELTQQCAQFRLAAACDVEHDSAVKLVRDFNGIAYLNALIGRCVGRCGLGDAASLG